MKEVARDEWKEEENGFRDELAANKKQSSVNAQKHVKALKLDGTMQTKVFNGGKPPPISFISIRFPFGTISLRRPSIITDRIPNQ